LTKLVEAWQQLIGAVFGAVVSAGAAVGFKDPSVKTAAAVVTGLSIVVLVFIVRRQLKDGRRRINHQGTALQVPEGAYFRRLQRFRSGERLPGASRRALAATLLQNVKATDFQICVVTGESGAGKSSLLECTLPKPMEHAGYAVVIVNGMQSVNTIVPQLNAPDIVKEFWQQITASAARSGAPSNSGTFLLLDQFEEVLSIVDDPNARRLFGDKLRSALDSQWRIVIGLRKEHLADLQEITRQLGRPLAQTIREGSDFGCHGGKYCDVAV
jgi:uncharacterized membrane protein